MYWKITFKNLVKSKTGTLKTWFPLHCESAIQTVPGRREWACTRSCPSRACRPLLFAARAASLRIAVFCRVNPVVRFPGRSAQSTPSRANLCEIHRCMSVSRNFLDFQFFSCVSHRWLRVPGVARKWNHNGALFMLVVQFSRNWILLVDCFALCFARLP